MQNFNYHQHTYRCGHADMDMTDEEYVKEYIQMGFKKIAFTDHCPEKNEIDKRQNMRMKYIDRNEYLDSVKKLKDKYADKIEIESGYEVEYLPGEEENLKELKEETDKIILGQHFVYDDNKELKEFHREEFTEEELIRYAEYVKKAIELGIPDIIAHPDIYMLNREKFGETESEVAHTICKTAEKYNVPLEINLCKIVNKIFYDGTEIRKIPVEEQKARFKKVFYPCREFWKIASEYDIKVLYGLDVHHRGVILIYKELIDIANEIIGEDIIDKLNFIEEL